MLTIKPCTLKQANEYVSQMHRHHDKVQGHKFSISAWQDDRLCGVAIAGRPVARRLDDGLTLEVTRVCTDGTKNACSILYGAVVRAAKALGYQKVVTYTLPDEGGASLRASGFVCDGEAGGGNWNCTSRPRSNSRHQQKKYRWSKTLGG